MSVIREYLIDLDQQWSWLQQDRITLNVIGSGALFLQTSYERGTKDADVFELNPPSPEEEQRLRSFAGRGTELHKKHRMYLDIVHARVPYVPRVPIFHEQTDLFLKNFQVFALDVVDVVVSKLKPFRPNDREDIAAMVKGGFVDHQKLVERFNGLVARWDFDARAEDLPHCVKNLHNVERNIFGVEESVIELPSWVAE